MFILLFSISCSSNEEPESEPKYLELAGTWRARYDAGFVYINIDNDGNFILTNNRSSHAFFYYTGKLADNFEYPYTIELVYDAYSSVLFDNLGQEAYSKAEPKQTNGKFTFIDASTCEAHFHRISWGGGWYECTYTNPNPSYYDGYFRKR